MGKYQCPTCSTIVEADDPAKLVCPSCGYGKAGGSVAAAPPAPAGSPYNPYAREPTPSTFSPHSQAPTGSVAMRPRTPGISIAALVLGIVGVVLYFLFIPAILAIVFGIMGIKQANADPANVGGKGMAIAGLVLGIVMLTIFVLAVLVFVLVGAAAWNEFGQVVRLV